ncbi:hypothetical protein PENANT_c040G03919 [Penicillium antarcticum]|uniref:Uncharacterized protein n=1 Tax=Penicillium antarcticum TaxID=416450 RepID=A0A1V6PSR1_9EURO|nr:uncharacterized protein N7508_000242 [Penicillium antarcticum]KAJ5319959.1 hypothetical protein N7508_000242 [Penicillium antarcticum]OQD80038.1 hypothetical protein PENANT_c040G03919 [Penicillium antarcticum]
MSDFIRRASDAFHNRQRQGSTDSTDAPTSPNAAKPPPDQEAMRQRSASIQSDSHVNEAFAGTATNNVDHPKYRRLWARDQQGKSPETKQQPSDQKRDNFDWIFGT